MKYITLLPLFFLGFSQTNAATFQPITFDEVIAKSESVIIAEIEKIESHTNIDASSELTDLRGFNIFTAISLKNVTSMDENLMGEDLEGAVLYHDGGMIPVPVGLKWKYKRGGSIGRFNTAVPDIRYSPGTTYILLLCGNGKYYSPFCGNPAKSIYTLNNDGTVSTLGGSVVTSVGEELGYQPQEPIKYSPAKESHGPTPPPQQEIETLKLQPISHAEMLNYIAQKRQAKNEEAQAKHLLSPDIKTDLYRSIH